MAALVVRILVLILLVYIGMLIFRKGTRTYSASARGETLRKKEHTDYDKDEWEKIKKSLGE